jgi:hypothetical protein
MWLNFFAPKGGISNTLSPQAIVTGLSPNADKHCKIPLGGYAQVYVDSPQGKSVMRLRTVGAISLGPVGNIQGTYKFMSLLTGRLINARSFTPLPMPEEVVTQVERMGTLSFNKEDEVDDISLAGSYSDISQGELADLLINNKTQMEANENYIPDSVPSQAYKMQIEGVDEELQQVEIFHDKQQSEILGNNNKLGSDNESEILSNNEELGSKNESKDKSEELESKNEMSFQSENHEVLITHDMIEKQNNSLEKEEDILETIDHSSRIQYVTKQGRNVKMRKTSLITMNFFKGAC